MVKTCFICKWSNDQQPRRSFHRFPREESKKKIWLDILGKSDVTVGKHTSICSVHFESSCFRYGLIYGKQMLAPDSVPSLYLTEKFDPRPQAVYIIGTPNFNNSSEIPNDKVVPEKKSDDSNSHEKSDLQVSVDLNKVKEEVTHEFTDEVHDDDVISNTNEELHSDNISLNPEKAITVSPSAIADEDEIPSKKICLRDISYENTQESINVETNDDKIFISEESFLEKIEKNHRIIINPIYLEELKGKLQRKTREIAILKRTVRRLRQQRLKSKSRIKELKKEIVCLNKKKPKVNVDNSLLHPLKKKGQHRKDIRIFASTIAFLSSRAYSYLRDAFPTLPHIRTLHKWAHSVDIEPGICEVAINIIEEKCVAAGKQGKKLFCSLTVDDMCIKKFVKWDGKKFTGLVTKKTKTVEIDQPFDKASKVMVAMVVCLNENWKIPMAYYFIDGLNGEHRAVIIAECLVKLHETNIDVVSLAFDSAPSNFKMAECLGADFNHTENLEVSIPHPVTKKPIFVFLDVYHAIKLVRNTLGLKKVLIDGDNNRIEWNHFRTLVSLQYQNKLPAKTRLRKRRVHYFSEKILPKYAAQLFSSSICKAFKYSREIAKVPELRNSHGTEKFCAVMTDTFNLLTSKQAIVKNPDNGAITSKNIEKVKLKVAEIEKYIKSLRLNESPILESDRKKGFLGLIRSMRNCIAIYETYVETEDSLHNLPTFKLSQEHLELFFSSVRSRGGQKGHPTTEQFESALKWIYAAMSGVKDLKRSIV